MGFAGLETIIMLYLDLSLAPEKSCMQEKRNCAWMLSRDPPVRVAMSLMERSRAIVLVIE